MLRSLNGRSGLAVVIAFAVVALGSPAMAACQAGRVPAPGVTRVGNVVTVDEDYPHPFDAGRGDTVNVRMTPGGDHDARCRDMGGILDGTLCRRVDF